MPQANKVDSLDDSYSSSSGSSYSSSSTSRGQGSGTKMTVKTHSSPSHDVPQEIAHDGVITEAVATISKRTSGMSAGRSGALDSFFKVSIDTSTHLYIHLCIHISIHLSTI